MFDSQIHCDVGVKKVNAIYPIPITEEARQEQLIWLKQELQLLKSESNDYVFLVTHYPVYVGERKPYTCMEDVDQLIKQSKLDGMIVGHVHMLYHAIAKQNYNLDTSDPYKLHYICSGMGALMEPKVQGTNSPDMDIKFSFSNVPKMKGGFATAEVNGKIANFKYYYAGAKNSLEPIYSHEIYRKSN